MNPAVGKHLLEAFLAFMLCALVLQSTGPCLAVPDRRRIQITPFLYSDVLDEDGVASPNGLALLFGSNAF
jgi:hypothetical protein